MIIFFLYRRTITKILISIIFASCMFPSLICRDKDSRNDIIKTTNKIHDCATHDYIVTRDESKERQTMSSLSHFTSHFRACLIRSKKETNGSRVTIGQSLRWIAELIAVTDGTVSLADTSTSKTLFKPKSVLPRVHLRTDAVHTLLLRARMRWWETNDGGMDSR